MNLFDILGPVMVGPSSSHTAGAVRMGRMARSLLGRRPVEAELLLHGSFASTGEGHGTRQALIAGLLGLWPDDPRVPDSFQLAEKQGLSFTFGTCILRDVHPNSALITLTAGDGGRLQYDSAGDPGITFDTVASARQASGDGFLPDVTTLRDPYAAELVEFAATREAGTTPRVTAADGVRAVEVAAAALESLRTGRSIAC